MSNNQFSALDNVKITCKHIGNNVTFTITIRKGIFKLKLVYFEYETSFYWKFEMVIVLK